MDVRYPYALKCPADVDVATTAWPRVRIHTALFYDLVSSPGEAYSPTGVERAAAVQVLAVELNRFKRVVSQRLDQQPPSDGSSKITGAADGGTVVVLQLGGFKALDQSVAATREVADFCRVVESIKALNSAEAVAQRQRNGGRARGRQGAGDRGNEPFTIKEGLFEPPFLLILHSLEVGPSGACVPIAETRRSLLHLKTSGYYPSGLFFVVDCGRLLSFRVWFRFVS